MPRVFIVFLLSLTAIVGPASHPGSAVAQAGVLRGVVTDTAGAPVAGAEISIARLERLTRTTDRGEFLFDNLPLGEVEVAVRRLGYEPQVVTGTVTNSVVLSFTISLAAQPAVLAAVSVDAGDQRLRLGLEEFYRRRARGVGTFFTREEILKRGARATSDVFRSTPGIRLVRVNGGQGIRLTSPATVKGRNCIPMIWIDGQHASGLEVDDIPVNDIEGMELYHGPATTPPQFWQGNVTECGTLVVWSRRPPS